VAKATGLMDWVEIVVAAQDRVAQEAARKHLERRTNR
jgi:hypothetical protein